MVNRNLLRSVALSMLAACATPMQAKAVQPKAMSSECPTTHCGTNGTRLTGLAVQLHGEIQSVQLPGGDDVVVK